MVSPTGKFSKCLLGAVDVGGAVSVGGGWG